MTHFSAVSLEQLPTLFAQQFAAEPLNPLGLDESSEFLKAFDACRPASLKASDTPESFATLGYEILGVQKEDCRIRIDLTVPKDRIFAKSMTCIAPKGMSFAEAEIALMKAAERGDKADYSCAGTLVDFFSERNKLYEAYQRDLEKANAAE